MSAARATPEISHNLPTHLSSFIGRRNEIAEVRQLLDGRRLVTLTGAGGGGKTRLALRVADDLLPAFEDGAWFIDFAPVDPDLVPLTVALALGAREQAGRSLTDTLTDHLRLRRLLLLFDNCEHLLEGAAGLAYALLQACPALKILATSREPLGVEGEAVWQVPPLSLPQIANPAAGVAAVLGAAPQSEAVQLFLARAEAATPGFALTAENTGSVEEICRRLDGMPLAIELAASRLRALSPREIAAHLDDRFLLLTGGVRTAPPRQQTLEATLDWSYALLSEAERQLLQRLSVFVGGCTVEAAQAVCSAADTSPGEVLDLLTHLVDKSLVLAGMVQEQSRYRLLETIREYARRRLMETGEAEAVRARHLEYFVAWAEQVSPLLPHATKVDWLGRFDVEHDNVRAALDWSLAHPASAQAGLRLAAAAGPYWRLRGFPQEGRARLAAALALPGAQEPTAARATALSHLVVLKFFESDYAAVRTLVKESLPIWESQGEAGRMGLAWDLETLAEVEAETGNYQSAFPLFEQALTLFRDVEDATGTADTVKMMGWTAMRTGDYELADRYLSEGLELCRQAGDRHHIASALAGLGELAIRRGELEKAERLLNEALGINRSLGDTWEIPIVLGSLGWAAMYRGDLASAHSLLGESLGIRLETGDRGGMAWCLEKLARIAVSQSAYRRAATLFAAASGLRQPVHSRLDAADLPEHERDLTAVREALSAEDFESLWAEGRRLEGGALLEFAAQAPETTAATRQQLKEEFGGLTAREREVARWIARGKSNREIAEAMTVGVRTVETYVTRILNKLGLDSRVQIATWALAKGLHQEETP